MVATFILYRKYSPIKKDQKYVLRVEGHGDDSRVGRRCSDKDLGRLVAAWKREGLGGIRVADKITTIAAAEISPPDRREDSELREPVSSAELIDFYKRMGLEK